MIRSAASLILVALVVGRNRTTILIRGTDDGTYFDTYSSRVITVHGPSRFTPSTPAGRSPRQIIRHETVPPAHPPTPSRRKYIAMEGQQQEEDAGTPLPEESSIAAADDSTSNAAATAAPAERKNSDLLSFSSPPASAEFSAPPPPPASSERTASEPGANPVDLFDEAVVPDTSGGAAAVAPPPSADSSPGDLLLSTKTEAAPAAASEQTDTSDLLGSLSITTTTMASAAVSDDAQQQQQQKKNAAASEGGAADPFASFDQVAPPASADGGSIHANGVAENGGAAVLNGEKKDKPTEQEPASSTAGADGDGAGLASTASAPPQQQQTQQQERIEFLEMELAKAKEQLNTQQQEGERRDKEMSELVMALQTKMQQQMGEKAEAENKARLAEAKIQDLEKTIQDQSKQIETGDDIQKVLQEHMTAKAEAEDKARQLGGKNQELEAKVTELAEEIVRLQLEVVTAREAKTSMQDEMRKIREQDDERERKQIALTSRLNAAKKKEGEQANLVERYEDEIRALEQDLEAAKKELSEVTESRSVLEKEIEQLRTSSGERIRHAERALADEQALNEERKKKMKAFVETRAEELRQTKEDNDLLQKELNQTNQSLMDLNNRWKQLHAQWVQAQTRNRELQRDLNRIKKDSENLHKVGGTLETKLARSATETEEHKNKRLAAKHELMTVLRTLEAEREINAKLRDSLKFTFTPKALSQQQLLHEGLEDFEAQLQKLSQRLGKPLPPASHNLAPVNDLSEHTDHSNNDGEHGDDAAMVPSRSNTEIQTLIAKLEYETQRVSQCIMALSGNIERMHMVLNASGERSCYTVLGELLTTGSLSSSPAAIAAAGGDRRSSEETRSITGTGPPARLAAIRSHRYGQVPSGAP